MRTPKNFSVKMGDKIMRFERITDAGHPMYSAAMALYRESFPAHELRESASQERILHDRAYHFDLAYDGETFVGLALCWEPETFIYVEHLCILPALRGHAYGSAVLALLAAEGKTVILEIDPPVDDISVRRLGFYERNGFSVNPYAHVHPPYHAGNHGHNLVVMSRPGVLTREEYDGFARYLAGHIMKGAY